MAKYDYLIIGGGMTADAAARGIRERDQNGRIGIITAELVAPYNRPPLTKGLWKGDAPETIWRKTAETGAEILLGRRVTKLEAAQRRVTDDAADTHEYGKLLLATGGTPRRLPNVRDGVIYYRTFDDYQQTRDLVTSGARFLVLGGGFIGTEIAAGIRMQGRDVTLVVPEHGLGAKVFPADLSRFVAEYFTGKGVTVKLGSSVEKIEKRDEQFVAFAKGGITITAEAIVAGLGITPNVDLAQQAKLKVSDGIEVDEQLRANGRDIYAAGDVARFFNPALQKQMRVEHEDNANTMGRMAGQNMAGAGLRYDHIPFFYSDLFDLGYEAVGEVDAKYETFADWKEKFREGVIYYLNAGRVRGVLLWNTWGQVDAARALIAEAGPFSPENLKGRLPAT